MTKKIIPVILGILALLGSAYFFFGRKAPAPQSPETVSAPEAEEEKVPAPAPEPVSLEVPAQETVREILGPPDQFVVTYYPVEREEGEALLRSEIWFYAGAGKKLTFLGGHLARTENYAAEAGAGKTKLSPEAFDINLEKSDLENIFGKDKVDPVDYLPGYFETGIYETYLTDQGIFVLEEGKLTYFQTFVLGPEETIAPLSFNALDDWLSVPRAEAKIRIKNAFRCLGQACRFVVNLPDKVTRPLGPVFGPIASALLTQNIGRHKELSRIFNQARKVDRVVRDVEEQKKIVSDVQKMYRDAAEEMQKQAEEVRGKREALSENLVSSGMSYAEFKAEAADLDKLSAALEAGAEKFKREADRTTLANVTKMLGRDLVHQVFGQARRIILDNVGREALKFVDGDILRSLVAQNERGADALLDMLFSGDLDGFLKGKDTSGIDLDELKKRVREEIKVMLREKQEDLKKNWKQKIAEILDRKTKELKAEKEKLEAAAAGEGEAEEEKETICDREPDPKSQCPSGYVFVPQSGVGCMQKDCKEGKIPNAHPSYTGQCICGSAGSIAENPNDPNKACALPPGCGACPSCVYACVKYTEECPPIPGK